MDAVRDHAEAAAFFLGKSLSESWEIAMSTPCGYERRGDPGLFGAVARWWLRRRTRRVAAALDEVKQASAARGEARTAAAERRSRRGWGEDDRRSAGPGGPRPRDVAGEAAESGRAGPCEA